MIKKLSSTFLLLATISSGAFAAEIDKENFCNEQTDIREKVADSANRLSFLNEGGLANGGVCWWHSRFTRNANYVAYFSPEKPRPTAREAKKLIKLIRSGKRVVEIPGFSDLAEFSTQHRNEIQQILEGWQQRDGIAKFQWIRGLSGKPTVSSEKLKRMMDSTYLQFQAGSLVYQKLQIKGITAHAWLIQNMVAVENGYEIDVIDSNNRSIQSYVYNYGDQSLHHYYYGDFTPYTEYAKEERKVMKTKNRFCKKYKS